MTALKEAGYETVTLRQVYDYVHHRGKLPEKPVLITMDDGYSSNLELAAPILEELDMCATVFVIGICEGETVYPHTGETFREPRFSYEEAREWVEKDVLDLQCHSYDMHQLESQGFSGRDGMLQKTGETGEEYRQALEADYQQFVEKRQGAVSTELMALAYPYGYCTEELDEMLEERFSVTITTQEHINLLRRGQEDTLRLLGRFNIEDGMTGQSIVERLDGLMNAG